MKITNQKEAALLLLGDILLLLASLWLTLFLRYGEVPAASFFYLHARPFALLGFLWLGVFFIAGLYEKHTVLLQNRLPTLMLKVELINSALAAAFFYAIPYFGIAPKRILIIYLLVSFTLLTSWRLYGSNSLGFRRKQKAFLIGSGEEIKELRDEVNGNRRYSLYFVGSLDLDSGRTVDFQSEVIEMIYSEEISVIAVDLRDEKLRPYLPHLYNLIFSKVKFIPMHRIYEDIFDRVPLSLVEYGWFLENFSFSPRFTYDILKRAMDILISIPLLIIPAFIFPFAYLGMKIEDGGRIFIRQKRIGRNNQPITLFKFRTMSFSEDGDWSGKGRENKITKVGAFLRKTRLDEFPQLWNVLRGDLSLIGPRPEFPEAVVAYGKEIPFYAVRHLIKPGLSGSAQIYGEHPHHGVDMRKTKNKLSYDLFYLKNRSFFLDLKIALKTLNTLLSRSGI